METWEEYRGTDTFKTATEEERRILREHYFKKLVNINPQIALVKRDFFTETEPDVLKPSKLESASMGVWNAIATPIRAIEKGAEALKTGNALTNILQEDKVNKYGLSNLITRKPSKEEIAPLPKPLPDPLFLALDILKPTETRKEEQELIAASRRQHPWWYYGGEIGGMIAGPGKVAGAVTKGMKLVPRIAARAGFWGTYGGGREAFEQVEQGGISDVGRIAKTGALWAAMEPIGEIGIGALKVAGRAVKRGIKGKPERIAKVLEEDLNIVGIAKNSKAKVTLGADKKPLIEITNPSGEIKKFTDPKFARKYIEKLAPPAEGKPVVSSGIKQTARKAVTNTTEDAIKNELRFMEREIAGYADPYHRIMVQNIRKGTGKGYEKARQVAYDRIQKRTAGLDTTGVDAAPHQAPISKKYIAEPAEGSFAPDPIPSNVPLADIEVGAWGGRTMPTKSFFSKLARNMQDNQVYKSFRNLTDGYRKMIEWERGYKEQARKILGSLKNNPDTRKTITYILENNTEQLAKRNPTATEYEMASQIRKLYDELFDVMGLDSEIYLKNYAPHFRKYFEATNDIDFSIIDPKWRKSIRWINELHRSGDLHLYEDDVLMAFDRYVHGAAKKKFLKEGYDYLRSVAKKLPKQEKEIVMDYTDTMYGWSPIKGYTGKAISRVVKKLGATPDEAKQIANLLHRQLYAGGLGLRPFPIIRNFSQQSLAMPVMGTKYWAEGAAKILSRSERMRVHKLGIIPAKYHPIGIGEEIETVIKGMRWPTKVAEAYQKLLDASLWAYRKSDAINREVVFLGYEKKILDIMKQLTKKGRQPVWSQLYKRANFKFFDKEILDTELKPLFSEGLIKKDWIKLAQQAAKNLVEDTQWIYSKGASPAIARNHPMLFQFGTWPLNAVHYMKRLSRLGPAAIAKQAAFWGALVTAGNQLFGVDVRTWIPLYSFLYRFGPVASTTGSFTKAVASTAYGSQMAPMAWKEFLNSLWIWMPAGLQMKAIVKGLEEEEGALRILGFRPSQRKKKSTGTTRGGRGGRSGGRSGR